MRFRVWSFLFLLVFSGCDEKNSKKNNQNNDVINNQTNNINNANNENNINNSNNVNNTNNSNNNNAGPCADNPCLGRGLHRTVCVEVAGEPGYECLCEAGFEDTGAGCELQTAAACPADTQCLADVCVPVSEPAFQCIGDVECHQNLSADAGNPTTCNNAVAGGVCLGCRPGEPDDCPDGFACTPFGSCARPCLDASDCPAGACDADTGFCTLSQCTADDQCPAGTRCVDADGNGSGLCLRLPCEETACSPYNPSGSCPSGSSCLGGACVDSCTPNPCTELLRTQCRMTPQGPACECDPGYEDDGSGRCEPVPQACPTGFDCRDGYCVDPLEPFQCVTNADCGGTMTCAPQLPTGTCRGCTDPSECPAGFDRCLAGYCLKSCTSPANCPTGMTCTNGYCGKKACITEADCGFGYTCALQSDSTLRCERIVCP